MGWKSGRAPDRAADATGHRGDDGMRGACRIAWVAGFAAVTIWMALVFAGCTGELSGGPYPYRERDDCINGLFSNAQMRLFPDNHESDSGFFTASGYNDEAAAGSWDSLLISGYTLDDSSIGDLSITFVSEIQVQPSSLSLIPSAPPAGEDCYAMLTLSFVVQTLPSATRYETYELIRQ